MRREQCSFEDYVRIFPMEFQASLEAKLIYKAELERDEHLVIPPRIWLAYLTPREDIAGKLLKGTHGKIWKLKQAMLEIFEHPRKFIDMRDPLHRSSEYITLSLMEILFDLHEKKVLLPRERYDEWLEVANHFGLWKLRYLLEDAIFKTFDPENFALFESVVAKQMFMDAHLVQAIRGIVGDALKRADIKNFSIENRTKNIYGVYKKVALKGRSVNDIYDIHGFRIFTANRQDCHKVIDVLHYLWPHISERYKDYIANPKENGYQSIHTVVNSLEGKPIEFQVRTKEMDMVAASGPANHADYKNASGKITSNALE